MKFVFDQLLKSSSSFFSSMMEIITIFIINVHTILLADVSFIEYIYYIHCLFGCLNSTGHNIHRLFARFYVK